MAQRHCGSLKRVGVGVKEVGVLEEVGVAMVVAVAKAEGAKVPGS